MSKVILLVEDNPTDEKLTIRAFRKSDVSNVIVVARDGVEALDYLFGTGAHAGRDLTIMPTVTLLDLKLPKIDGLEVLKRIRADERTKMLPVVILTTSKEDEDIVRSYSLGVNAFVRKPVDFGEFAKVARTIGLFWLLINEAPGPDQLDRSPDVRALLVEDSITDAKLIASELEKSFPSLETERIDTAAAMRLALTGSQWDVVICDWAMPRFNAVEALSLLKDTGLDLPFIIVSGTVGEDNAVRAMRAGARDYLLKDKLDRLAPAVEREIQESAGRKARVGAEDALRQSLARFARLSESGIVGITTADVMGHVLEPNDAYLKMLGYSREDFDTAGLNWTDMTPPEFRAVDARTIELLKTRGVAPPFEKEMIRKDGSRLPVLIGVAMLDHPQCIALVADISERRRSEQALQQSQEQFRQSQKMEAIGRLAGGIAHDFNNLLSVILIYTEVGIQTLGPTEPLTAELAEVMKAAQRGAALTKQLLAFSRQQILEFKIVDLNELIARLGKMLGRVIGEDIELALRPAADVGSVRADPGQIEQVLMNLAVNARDAMPRGGKLTIETSNVVLNEEYASAHLGVEPGRYVMVGVSDTGIGMDKALQARIFEPFFTTKEVGKGTGLGLSTVFGIVQQSKGHIWIYSEPGVGTTFKVYLPRTDEAVTPIEVGRDEISDLRGTETILLVEDEEQIRNVIVSFLRRLGYHVLEARNGGEGLLVAEKHPGKIDLLLTDVVMPHMSGAELVKRVASIRPDMRVLCMSGYADEAVLTHGILEAGLAFLQKPITSNALARKIRLVLAAGKADAR